MQCNANQTRSDQIRPDQIRPDQTRSDQENLASYSPEDSRSKYNPSDDSMDQLERENKEDD